MLKTNAVIKAALFTFCCLVLFACTNYSVKPTADGYLFQGLPAPLLKEFPGPHEIVVTIADRTHDGATVRGRATLRGRQGLQIVTSDRFGFDPRLGSDDTWLLIRSDPGIGGAPGTCRGCPRDHTLQIYGDASICWCFSKLTDPGQGAAPSNP